MLSLKLRIIFFKTRKSSANQKPRRGEGRDDVENEAALRNVAPAFPIHGVVDEHEKQITIHTTAFCSTF